MMLHAATKILNYNKRSGTTRNPLGSYSLALTTNSQSTTIPDSSFGDGNFCPAVQTLPHSVLSITSVCQFQILKGKQNAQSDSHILH